MGPRLPSGAVRPRTVEYSGFQGQPYSPDFVKKKIFYLTAPFRSTSSDFESGSVRIEPSLRNGSIGSFKGDLLNR